MTSFRSSHPVLLCAAAPLELRAIVAGFSAGEPPTTPTTHTTQPIPNPWETLVLSPSCHLLHLGVSKANAAGALAATLSRAAHPYAAVINLGIAGALPDAATGSFALRPGDAVLASSCVFGDEGIVTPEGYQSVGEMGFPLDTSGTGSFACDDGLVRALRDVVDRLGAVATVSICSGTNDLARTIAARTGALAETMEGAACALVCERYRTPFCEVRTISNFTGDRAAQQWDIAGASARLARVASLISDRLALRAR